MKTVPVFFSPEMVASIESSSPSAGKPIQVVESWKRLGIPLEIFPPAPASVDEIKRVHDPKFVEDILQCHIDNGFENRSPDVARSLPYTSGAMLSAARFALKNRAPVAAAPCSGFHHAEYGKAMGFCTFNGLMVTAVAVMDEGLAAKVGILDFDMHYGNGTDDIIKQTASEDTIEHFTAGASYQWPEQAGNFFLALPMILERFQGCNVILYQAGADPHIDDPYGGWLTTEQLKTRDLIVFSTFKAMGIPVVWNLAGGYQVEPDGSIPKVLEIHDNTMRACAEVYLVEKN